MGISMRCKLLVYAILSSLFLFRQTWAEDNNTVLFSPYVDLTINTYWDPVLQKQQPMDLVAVVDQQKFRAIRLAFLEDAGQCEPAWGGIASYSLADKWGEDLAKRLAQRKVMVIVSFGGAAGRDLSTNCSVEQMKLILSKAVEIYHATGLDFDIENGTEDLPTLIQALQIYQLQNPKIKISFTLPTMPSGLTSRGKEALALAKTADLHFSINLMVMNYGAAYTGNMAEYAKMAAKELFTLLCQQYPKKSSQEVWQMIELTPMIGMNNSAGELFTLEDASDLYQFAKTQQIGGLSMWSISRDKPCADEWPSPTCSSKNLQKEDFEFSKQLNNHPFVDLQKIEP